MTNPEDDAEAEQGASGARVLGLVTRAAGAVGRTAAQAYHAVDPDLRRHALQAPALGLTFLLRRPNPVHALPDDGGRAIVFAHGLGGHPGNLVPLQRYLARHGRTRTYHTDFGEAASMADMSEVLRGVINDVRALNGLGPRCIDVVAHSMGGLIARLAMDDPSTRRAVANIVTLGTPHRGSHLARLAATQLVLELRPGSPVMERLDAQSFWGHPDEPLVTALWSENDTIVIPADNARFEAGRNVRVDAATHYSYLLRPQIWRLVLDSLKD